MSFHVYIPKKAIQKFPKPPRTIADESSTPGLSALVDLLYDDLERMIGYVEPSYRTPDPQMDFRDYDEKKEVADWIASVQERIDRHRNPPELEAPPQGAD